MNNLKNDDKKKTMKQKIEESRQRTLKELKLLKQKFKDDIKKIK